MKLIGAAALVAAGAVAVSRTSVAQMQMGASRPLGISMDRMGSGTSWIPDAVQLPSRHAQLGSWDMMVHGFVFLQYDRQGGPRGDEQMGSLNWGMATLGHSLAGGRFEARAMLSLDAATVSSRGYPLLLQTGETYDGVLIHDRQHPHDLFKELGVAYERGFTNSLGVSLYVAASGEPALGPVAFMHRPSAMDSPFAGLGHHWQDATHISFGVVTAGIFSRRLRLEASAFNGRAPNEDRWGIDRMRLDSYSARATINPAASWSMSAAFGFLDSPEVLDPDASSHRLTASVMHGVKLGTSGQWASTLVWGANKEEGEATFAHSFLLETEAVLNTSNTVFARAERVEKSAADLVVDTPATGFPSARVFNVSAVSVGYVREVARGRGVTIGIGGQATANFVGSALEGVYGSRHPLGGALFVRLRPVFAPPMTHMHPGM